MDWKNIPQGLKPRDFCCICGTAKAVPFQSSIYESASKVCSDDFLLVEFVLSHPFAQKSGEWMGHGKIPIQRGKVLFNTDRFSSSDQPLRR
jgi:hypothetical protein